MFAMNSQWLLNEQRYRTWGCHWNYSGCKEQWRTSLVSEPAKLGRCGINVSKADVRVFHIYVPKFAQFGYLRGAGRRQIKCFGQRTNVWFHAVIGGYSGQNLRQSKKAWCIKPKPGMHIQATPSQWAVGRTQHQHHARALRHLTRTLREHPSPHGSTVEFPHA